MHNTHIYVGLRDSNDVRDLAPSMTFGRINIMLVDDERFKHETASFHYITISLRYSILSKVFHFFICPHLA
jgi:hypothetical protein